MRHRQADWQFMVIQSKTSTADGSRPANISVTYPDLSGKTEADPAVSTGPQWKMLTKCRGAVESAPV